MQRTYCAVLLVLANICSFAQWAPAGNPTRTFGMSSIVADTMADVLYFCGESSLNGDFLGDDQTVSVLRDHSWSTFGNFLNRPFTIRCLGDTVFVGGAFPAGNNISVPRLQCYSAGVWSQCGAFDGNIYRLKVVNGDLFALGSFDVVDGQSAQGIAKRENGQWVPVGSFDVASPPYIQDLVSWNGTLYTTGVISYSAEGPNHVAYLNNGQWLPLGLGIRSGFGAGRALAVYNNELYVSGSIPIGAGNAGHGIMRWDGQQYRPVGTGFQGLDGTYLYLVGAAELEVYDGKLWACGSFSYAGNVPCPGIATWDGARWCGLPLGPEPEINTIEFFHDTLFASCHVNLNGIPVNCAVRYTGSTYPDTCSVAVGLAENSTLPSSTLRAYRRADGLVEVIGLPAGRFPLQVFDPLGREVLSRTIVTNGQGALPLEMPALPLGISYFRVGELGTVRFLGP